MATPLKLDWTPMPFALQRQQLELDRVLRSWEHTPYMPRKQDCGHGVDCVRFVCAVLDTMRGRQTPIETLPDDTAMHDRVTAIAGMLKIRRAMDPNILLKPADGSIEVQPGDVIVTGPANGGPGHAMIVGSKRNVFWESAGSGVRRVGLSALRQHAIEVYYVFRCLDRDTWKAAP